MKWLEAIQRAAEADAKGAAAAVPPGFETRAQIQKRLGLAEAQTRLILRKMVEAGLVERRCFRAPTAGYVRPVPHYKLNPIKK